MRTGRVYSSDEPLLSVEKPEIGKRYHLSWAKKTGMVWVLVGIDGRKALLQTPKTKKKLTAWLADLRHTRHEQSKIEHQRRLEVKTS
jgi:hypothetical protein